jgi:hypothetical protein
MNESTCVEVRHGGGRGGRRLSGASAGADVRIINLHEYNYAKVYAERGANLVDYRCSENSSGEHDWICQCGGSSCVECKEALEACYCGVSDDES